MIGLSRTTLLSLVVAVGTTVSVRVASHRDATLVLNTKTLVAAAPTALVASMATSSAVTLVWTGSATEKVAIERKVQGSAWLVPTAAAPATAEKPTPSTVGIVTATTFSDSKIDAFTTYVYRVRAVGANNVLGAPSNELTVGPPPVGISSVLAAPKAMQDHSSDSFATLMRMVMDANGDPSLAYMTNDLNSDGEMDDTDLSVITWNRAKYRWNAPVVIDTIGNVARGGNRLPISLARDASTGQYGLLHMIGDHELRLSTSDDAGMTWKHTRIDRTGNEEPMLSTPALVMAGGRIYLAYSVMGGAVTYKTGALADAQNKWTTAKAPIPPSTEMSAQGVSIALDASGKPVVTYFLAAEAYNTIAMLWRPDVGKTVKIADSNNNQNDDPGMTLTISGSQIGVALYMSRDEQFFANHHIWFARSTDNGATFSAPVVLADDGGDAMASPLSVSIDKTGKPVVIAHVDGGNEGTAKCGRPKLMRSLDGVKWTTCAADTKGAPSLSDVVWPVGAFAANDKLYIAFKTRATVPGLPAGVNLWRER